jgi:hypothetical protein
MKNIRFLVCLFAIFITGMSSISTAQELAPEAKGREEFFGRWKNNATHSNPIDFADIHENRVVLEISTERFNPNGTNETTVYYIENVTSFGEGLLFEVASTNRDIDPYGCGSTRKVSYIVERPIPGPSTGVLSTRKFMRLTFYSGESPPSLETIGNDPKSCTIEIPFRK